MARVSDTKQRLITAIGDLMLETSYSAVTVDAVCTRAQVKKGSFYYFFHSKADLAVQAVAVLWEARRRELDAFFSPLIPPLERLVRHFESIYVMQREHKARCGRVLGCPYFTLGAEAGALDGRLLEKVQGILDNYGKYFESAIRDARAEDLIRVEDTRASARCVFSLFEGMVTRARIENDPEVLRDLSGYVMQVLGARAAQPVGED